MFQDDSPINAGSGGFISLQEIDSLVFEEDAMPLTELGTKLIVIVGTLIDLKQNGFPVIAKKKYNEDQLNIIKQLQICEELGYALVADHGNGDLTYYISSKGLNWYLANH
jgi:hypothetical protein